jgi:tetratricopeptide (TPR) repeat protein
MPVEQKDTLFTLIKSLSKSEKRQFKLYVGRLGGNADANFMSLFNLFDKSATYDEQLVLKKTNIKKQQISNTKAHLYKQILVSLRLSPIHQNTRTQLREQFDFATILYNKGLYKQSLKILEKAKFLAIDKEEYTLAYEMIELEKVIESQYITRSMNDRADVLAVEAKNISQKNVTLSKLSNLSLQLYSWFLKYGYVRNDKDYKTVNDYYEARLPTYDFSSLGFTGKMFLFQSKLWYGFITQDFLSCYRYSQKLVALFEEYADMKLLHPVFYLKAVNYSLESLFYLQQTYKFNETLIALEHSIEYQRFFVNENTQVLSNLYLYQHKINLYYLEGEFEKGTAFVPEILEQISAFGKKIDQHHVMLFYYKIGCLYFGAGDYENCIKYLSKIIKNKDLKMREDLLCYSRVLNLVAHYESGFDENIDDLVKSTYKFLLKMDNLYDVQRKMIKFLRNLSEMYPHELKEAFRKLHSELKQFENHPYEKRAFLYLDIISWLESNIEGVPVEEVVKRKMSRIR